MKILGIVLIVLGAVVLFRGFSREDSLVGQASEVGTDLANAVDGGARQPDHIVMIVGGGIMVALGAVLAFRGRRAG